jgi:hypothetical protein
VLRLDEKFLNEMRKQGDLPADTAIAVLRNSGRIAEVRQLLDQLVGNDDVVPESLPQEIRTFWEMGRMLAEKNASVIKEGEDFFAQWGPEIVLVLGFGSLPMDYAARGVRVLRETGELLRNTNRRVFETMQMVIDVMSPGGLTSTGRGITTAQKVRLMHAAIRAQILHSRDDPKLLQYRPWDPSLGVPINQEDLAGTLISFSYAILVGLQKLGCSFNIAEQEAFLRAWGVIARIMGIVDDLIPDTMDEATQLAEAIVRRQISPSADSTEMIVALLKMYRSKLPGGVFGGIPAATMRFFVPPEIANKLDIPESRVWGSIIRLYIPLLKFLNRYASQRPGLFSRRYSIKLLQGLIDQERGGSRSKFSIPESLDRKWQVSARFQPPSRLEKIKKAFSFRSAQ